MARKSKSAGKDSVSNLDHKLAFFSYQMGFTATWFPSLTSLVWKIAKLDHPVPPGPRVALTRLLDVTRRLSPHVATSKTYLSTRVLKAAEQACAGFEAGWGQEHHCAVIEERDASEQEYYNWEAMLKGSPLQEPVWGELRESVEAFFQALPGEFLAWVRLGQAVVSVFDPQLTEVEQHAAIPLLQNQLASMLPHPLLDGLPMGQSLVSPKAVDELHSQLWQRLGEGRSQGDDLSQAPPRMGKADLAEDGVSPIDALPPEVRALALLTRYPEMTVTEIARRVKVSRTSLYRMSRFAKAIKMLKQGKRDWPRGIKCRDRKGDSYVDVVDDHDPSEDIDD